VCFTPFKVGLFANHLPTAKLGEEVGLEYLTCVFGADVHGALNVVCHCYLPLSFFWIAGDLRSPSLDLDNIIPQNRAFVNRFLKFFSLFESFFICREGIVPSRFCLIESSKCLFGVLNVSPFFCCCLDDESDGLILDGVAVFKTSFIKVSDEVVTAVEIGVDDVGVSHFFVPFLVGRIAVPLPFTFNIIPQVRLFVKGFLKLFSFF
jgi:hypothetical protein